MKIEGNRPNAEASAAKVESVKAERMAKAGRGAAAGGDRVELSSDAQLVSSAVKAAEAAPAVRDEAIERARQKLLAGEIGNDLNRLADRLIDHLLEK